MVRIGPVRVTGSIPGFRRHSSGSLPAYPNASVTPHPRSNAEAVTERARGSVVEQAVVVVVGVGVARVVRVDRRAEGGRLEVLVEGGEIQVGCGFVGGVD